MNQGVSEQEHQLSQLIIDDIPAEHPDQGDKVVKDFILLLSFIAES